ncbi:helix-turn-helix transcriptional regulator [Roseibium sp. RKSG952]|uniref:helix-turn-helix transcriptional regulator n=1 Tax=Roseibium sp. RKSG952 TaxID=2529384 RepID=UPI0012BC941B|nr:helix-turn-helix transcriptional regulator [Roseibium sp. RKSG952]MTH96113.1 hypothetical protein [Roseibium sp. RKSG952]
MFELTTQDEFRILENVHDCMLQHDRWNDVLSQAERIANSRLYLLEFDRYDHHTGRYCGPEKAAELIDFLSTIKTEGSKTALSFLLHDASLSYPYCKANLLAFALEGAEMLHDVSDKPDVNDLRTWPGLICPLIRTGHRVILFGCLFPGMAIASAQPQKLSPPFQRLARAILLSLNVQDKMENAAQLRHALHLVMDNQDTASIVLDRNFKLVQPASGSLLPERLQPLFDEHSGRLVSKDKHIEQALISVSEDISQMLQERDELGDTLTSSRSVFIHQDNRRASHIRIKGVAAPESDSRPRLAHILIELREQAPAPETVTHVLSDRFGLSGKEAELAFHLSATGSMQETLAHLSIKRNTAKTHLRRIYEKTGAQSQLELARLVHELGRLF